MHLITQKGLTFGTKFRIKKVLLCDPTLSAKLKAELGGEEL
jgi:hypothetical protein